MHTFPIWKLLAWLVALLLLVLLLGLGITYFSALNSNQTKTISGSTPTYLVPLLQAKMAGDDQAAITQYQSILNDPQVTNEQKAFAAINIAGVAFNVSGDVQSELNDVDAMKGIVLDQNLSANTRATAMSILGNAYNSSGNNMQVFNEVFKGDPLSTYLVSGNPQLSDLNVEEASYALSKTSTAAIYVAQIASGQYFQNPQQSASTTAAYAATAQQYLGYADTQSTIEAQTSYYTNSNRYMIYRAGRAIVAGRLAIEVGAPYEKLYRNEFQNFFQFAQTQKSTLAQDETLSVLYQYAKILAADKDVAGEKTQLDQLAQDLNTLANPAAHPLGALLLQAHANRSGATWLTLKAMFAVSPNFAAAVTKLVTASSPSST
ncbi:MAG: hypothetical protein P4L81_01775 [Candidatus Pacebacteria bacterium]|nr:hypothetical protein [Candidatus Paceibacterota bacterium]